MNYTKILKDAWQITWNNRFLWWFGLFLVLGGGGANFNFPTNFSNDLSDEKMSSVDTEKIMVFLSNNWQSVAGAIALIFIFFLLGIIVRGGLILSVNDIIKKETVSFSSHWKKGKAFFFRLLAIRLILGFLVLAAFIILIVPVAFLFYSHFAVGGALMAILALLIIIPLIILIAFTQIYADIYVVLGNLGVRASLENACNLFQKNLKESVIMGLLLFGISLAMGMGISVKGFAGVVFVLLGLVFQLMAGKIGIYIVIALGLLTLLILLFFVRAVYEAFSGSAWVLFFREIAIPREEEKIEEPVSEIPKVIVSPDPVKGIILDKKEEV